MNSTLTLKERFHPKRFLRGERPTNDPVTLTHRRIFILPSHRGLGFVILLLLLLLVAFVYNNNLAYILTFLLASIFFISILHSYQSIAGIVVSTGKSEPVFAEQAACFELILTNPTRTAKINLSVSAKNCRPQTVSLEAEADARITLLCPTQHRGWFNIDSVTVYSYFPLGLFRAWSPLRTNQRVLIYPKPANTRLAFPESEAASSGEALAVRGQDEFSGIKSYQAGDPIKHIHWKAYAKGIGLYSKAFGGEEAGEIWFDFQLTPGRSVEDRLSQLCRWILDTNKTNIVFGLRLSGTHIQPAFGEVHQQQCLEALALFKTTS
ncbi:MAG: DUF58 domain-containing protein [Methylococcaceae bacterium]